MKFSILKLQVLVLLLVLPSNTFESSIKDNVLNYFGWETCSSHFVRSPRDAAILLQKFLKTRLFGQHLVRDGLFGQIYAHLDTENPSSPLIISLHGPPGSGKTFTAEIVAEALYLKGDQSRFVKVFTASYHFPDPEQVEAYKTSLVQVIRETVAACPRSLFIFDEVEKLHPGLLDALVPLINHGGKLLDGINYKKAIFLFLGNAGAEAIKTITLEHTVKGLKRQDLQMKDFQSILSNEAFNTSGQGWYQSEVIEKILVNLFIPYLPMERHHVMECFRRYANDHQDEYALDEDDLKEMANQLTYWPAKNPTFADFGCKRVENIVLYEIKLRKSKYIKIDL